MDDDLEITYEVDFNTVGEYKVTASAKDGNDNEVTKEITVVVKVRPVVKVPPKNISNSSN